MFDNLPILYPRTLPQNHPPVSVHCACLRRGSLLAQIRDWHSAAVVPQVFVSNRRLGRCESQGPLVSLRAPHTKLPSHRDQELCSISSANLHLASSPGASPILRTPLISSTVLTRPHSSVFSSSVCLRPLFVPSRCLCLPHFRNCRPLPSLAPPEDYFSLVVASVHWLAMIRGAPQPGQPSRAQTPRVHASCPSRHQLLSST